MRRDVCGEALLWKSKVLVGVELKMETSEDDAE